MKKIVFGFLTCLILVTAGCMQAQVQESTQTDPVIEQEPARDAVRSDLIGDWQVEAGDFAEITIDEDAFYTFLHERPFDFGTWTFATGTLTLSSDAGLEYVFTNISIQDGMLSLTQESSTESWIPIITE